jgi:hypothetical protein
LIRDSAKFNQEARSFFYRANPVILK